MANVIYLSEENKIELNFNTEFTLLQNLIEHCLFISAPCAGSGSCGKCLVKIDNCIKEADAVSLKLLTTEQISQGVRLACKTYPFESMVFSIVNQNSKAQASILSYYEHERIKKDIQLSKYERITDLFTIILDIGTTTIAAQMLTIDGKQIISDAAVLNSQRIYGTDVISRIAYSLKNNTYNLQKALFNSIFGCFDNLIKNSGLQNPLIAKILISGNTTMTNSLLGLSLKGLSSWPFNPEELKQVQKPAAELFKDTPISSLINNETELIILPGISAFVGSDIVSGIYFSDPSDNQCSLFVDLGTNAEMALFFKGKIFCGSAAAGPAFEGGSISCGIGSIAGAIDKVVFSGGQFGYTTIAKAPANGICGSGIVSTISECLKHGLIDCNGKIENGDKILIKVEPDEISLTQQDIYNFMLAKSAVSTGIQIMMDQVKINFDNIDIIYLAGGFAAGTDKESLMRCGIIPKELKNKIQVLGNTSLGGLRRIAINNSNNCATNIKQISTEIELANSEKFKDLFIKNITFGV